MRIGYTNPRWRYFDEHGCVEVRCSRQGFRDREFTVAKPRGTLRILAIGDSFTFGLCVRAEDAWPKVLEATLRSEGGAPVEVINAGFGANGDSPAGYESWLASDGIYFAPDLVIVGFCLNDMGDVPLLSYPVVPHEPVLGGFSRLLDHVVWQIRQRRARDEPRGELLAKLDLVRWFPQWQASQRGLRGMQSLLAAKGVPMVVVVFPMLTQLAEHPFARLHALVTEFCAGAGIRCLDLGHVFDGRVEEELWVHPIDQHPNDVAHRVLAARIREYLRAEALVPCPPVSDPPRSRR